MNRKNVIILLICVLILLGAVALFWFFGNNEKEVDNLSSLNSQTDTPWAEQKILTNIRSVDEFKSILSNESFEYELATDNSGGSIYGVDFLGNNTYITYYFDKEGKTSDFSWTYYLNMIEDEDTYEIEEINFDLLAEKTYTAVEGFCSMFDFNAKVDLYLTNNDGTFTKIESNENFRTILDEQSYLDFSIRDVDGYYWLMRVSYNGELAYVNIYKYFDVQMYLGYEANISLYEEDK